MKIIEPYLVDKPYPLIGAKTIQLIVMREILDYTVLRTEEDRQLNTVYTPLSVKEDKPTRRVAFLATKQKAAESRQLEQLLRTAAEEGGLSIPECYLKDKLCMKCPRCGLYGATSTESGQSDRANIKHRIEYSTAFSLLPYENIATVTTFNAINDRNITTGQALGSRYAVAPATLFPSIVTLKSVTWIELVLAVKTLLACKSYGAESRIGGDVRNTIIGVIAGWEEVITSLELTLELYDRRNNNTPANIAEFIKKDYVPKAGNPDRVIVLEEEQTDELIKGLVNTALDKGLLEKAYKDIKDYRSMQIG
ncbi:MAG: type I-D CRISPR-associated protein Cas7/Csc2 [Pelotomaculaceae bacterium]|jgi:CRISPR type I-D-associated protein Csc2|uniref:Type I-D CRISPR-associated protein Cas7/Csc2 n=1 Tax=anaerobic digester metagenome TaxID=1263854 RepID=A0A485M7A3_9ZZZZ|nr:type I-D CRISPR-associated protein Cas7/Csc2 [Peptococcaceae bacterium]